MTTPQKFRIVIVESKEENFAQKLEDTLNQLDSEGYSVEIRSESPGTYLIFGVHNEKESEGPPELSESLKSFMEQVMGGSPGGVPLSLNWAQSSVDIYKEFKSSAMSAHNSQELRAAVVRAAPVIMRKYPQETLARASQEFKDATETHQKSCPTPKECHAVELLTAVVSVIDADIRLSTH